jgi:hypothetical protein
MLSINLRDKYYQLSAERYSTREKMRLAIEEAKAPHLLAAREAEAQVSESFKGKLKALDAEVIEAKALWDAQAVAEAVEEAKTKTYGNGLMVGDIVCEWQKPYSWAPYTTTGNRGVVSIWRPDSDHPVNQCSGYPEPGEVYIRLLKKDGTPSKEFRKWINNWYKEGVVPVSKKA